MEPEKHAIVIVRIDVAPEMEEEFNRWYDQEHVPNLLAVPGVISGKRATNTGDGPRYIAIYEHENINIQYTEAYRKAVDTEWTRKIRPYLQKVKRDVYEVI
jgi:hypothetical protein